MSLLLRWFRYSRAALWRGWSVKPTLLAKVDEDIPADAEAEADAEVVAMSVNLILLSGPLCLCAFWFSTGLGMLDYSS